MNWFRKVLLMCFCLIVFCVSVEASPKVTIEQYDNQEDYISVTYPHFDGMENKEAQDKMNSMIETIVNKFVSSEEYNKNFAENHGELRNYHYAKMIYEIHYNDGDLVSLALYTNAFFGGAHGRQRLDGYTFDLRTGNVIPFNGIFKWDDQNRNVTFNKIQAQMSERKDLSKHMNTSGLVRELQNSNYIPNYYLADKGKPVMVFQPYEIADYSAGILRFEI